MIGKTISHYKILSKLGEGGIGVVYSLTGLFGFQLGGWLKEFETR